MSQIEIVEAAETDKSVLRQLLELYQYDFSEFDAEDVDSHGLYGSGNLDAYWIDPDRHPFLFRVDGRWAGFALVRSGKPHDMAEFFVMRKFRRSGIGTELARGLFARFPGQWQVREMTYNPDATSFWRRAIPVPFEEDANEEGPRQRFTISSAPAPE